jgi:mannobiose 2-epimerase
MTSDEMVALADEMDASLWKDLIQPWFPACVDPLGGFWQVFDHQWQRKPSSVRGVVFQSRMTWVSATLSTIPGPRKEEFAKNAIHGMRYLCDVFVSPENGAVRWKVDKTDQFTDGPNLAGHSYGAAFAIYALGAVHRALGTQEALDAAFKAFEWLDKYVRDAEHGGYFESVSANGRPVLTAPDQKSAKRGDEISTPFGLKSQNTHLHLLEAFSELAKSRRDPLLLERLAEVKEILEDRLFQPAGWLYVYAKPDWTPVPDRVSYGHDIEAAHLLMDACETLEGSISAKTQSIARALVDNTLMFGFDQEFGGFFSNGTEGGRPLLRSKNWWTQAEALLGLARATELADAPMEEYLEAISATWAWIRDHQIDAEYGGWFEMMQTDGTPSDREDHKDRKGHMWKAAYHETRALVETAKILRVLSTES